MKNMKKIKIIILTLIIMASLMIILPQKNFSASILGEKTTTIGVTEKETPVRSIKLNHTDFVMYNNKSFILTAYLSPSNATNQELVFSTNNTNVIQITGSGKSRTITAKKIGTATITVTSKSNSSIKAICKVTVKLNNIEDQKITVNGKTLTKAQYSNFRNVYSGNIGKGILYRCADPIVNSTSKKRALYTDQMLEQHNVKTIFNLADSDEEIAKDALNSPYYKTLYNSGKVYARHIQANYTTTEFQKNVTQGLRFFVQNKGPYAIHCKVGKDRTGFVLMLIECLMDVPYDYMYIDFGLSFKNYNSIKSKPKTNTELAAVYNKYFSRNLRIITGVTAKNVNNPKKSDWSKVYLVKCAENYLKKGGMTSKEITILKENLSGKAVRKINSKKVTLPLGDKVYFLDTQYISGSILTNRASDAIILESNGKYGMIDTGREKQSSKVVKYLKEFGISELEFIILTHSHGDHTGGYSEILKNITVKKVYFKNYAANKTNNLKGSTEIMKKLENLSKKSNVAVKYANEAKNQTIKLGNISMKLYNASLTSVTNDNDNSLGVLAAINGKKVFFAADLGADAMINVSKKIGKVDIYKIAHHGNIKDNPKEALQILDPQYAIVTNSKEYKTKVNERISGKTYFSGEGTVALNINESGTITLKQVS